MDMAAAEGLEDIALPSLVNLLGVGLRLNRHLHSHRERII